MLETRGELMLALTVLTRLTSTYVVSVKKSFPSFPLQKKKLSQTKFLQVQFQFSEDGIK